MTETTRRSAPQLRFDGCKSPERRRYYEARLGQMVGAEQGATPLGPVRAYRKTALTIAVRVDVPFEVDTLEGLHAGKAGDYLAVGAHGEMYPIDAAVFADTYELVEDGS